MSRPPAVLGLFWTVLKLLVVANLLFGAFVVAALVATFVAPREFVALLGSPGASASVIEGLRLLAAIGLLSVPLSHRILTRLIAIVETVRDGDPFVEANAIRLATMAWSLLGLEALHLGSILVAVASSDETGTIDWSFSIAGWLAVLLLFVLARVFEEGTRLRADLEGTI
jgi:hypothetical protein